MKLGNYNNYNNCIMFIPKSCTSMSVPIWQSFQVRHFVLECFDTVGWAMLLKCWSYVECGVKPYLPSHCCISYVLLDQWLKV